MDEDLRANASARAKIRIQLTGSDYRMTDQAAADIYAIVAQTGARVSGPFPMHSKIATSIYLTHEEVREHVRLLEVINSNPKTVDALRRHNVPTGIEIAILAPKEIPSQPLETETPPAKRNRRHDNRVVAMQFLVSWEIQRHADMITALFDFFKEQPHAREYYSFAEELIQGVIRDLPLIDDTISKHAQNWSFNRIARVDLAILRVSLFELMRRTDIPPIVSINEAVDIAKQFSTDESKRFINGILDKYKNQLKRDPRKAETP